MEWVVLCLLCLTNIFLVQATTESGNTFFLALPLTPENQSPTFELIVTVPSGEASFVVEASNGTINRNVTTPNQPARFVFNNTLMVRNGTEMKGIRVRATGQSLVSVLVVVRYPTPFTTGIASYTVHSNREMENSIYEYFALSTDYTGLSGIVDRRSNIVLVGNSNNTVVRITPTQTVILPRPHSTGTITVNTGSTYETILQEFQTLLISSLSDLTGTRIVSNKPLTVISGHQCAQIPTTTPFCEPLYFHVPPTASWGQSFLLGPFAGRTSGSTYKVVASLNNTRIAHRCGMLSSDGSDLPNAGSSTILAFTGSSFCSLIANSSILVAQVGPGHFSDFVGDPSVALVSPVSGHIHSTHFLSMPDFDNFITVTVHVENFTDGSQIHLDEQQLSCSWVSINDAIDPDNIVGYGCTRSVSPGTHNVSHTVATGLLSVVAYGWSTGPELGYAYLTGINLAESNTEGPSIVFEEGLAFFDLSGISGVQELPREVDAHSPPIRIPGSVVFGDELLNRIYVNENGAFSFQSPWDFSHPNPFPTSYQATRQRYVIAPFWSDNDIRREGTVRYLTILTGSAEGSMIMNAVTAYVNDRFFAEGEGDFVPTWMIVAQWDRVHPHPHGSDNHEGIDEEYLSRTNTYQGTIITNTTSTYYIFSYTCGDIQWSGRGFEAAAVGYNARGDYFINHPANGFPDIGRIISCTRQIASRNRRRRAANSNSNTNNNMNSAGGGKTDAGQTLTDAICACRQAIGDDEGHIQNIDSITVPGNSMAPRLVDLVPTCPPTRSIAEMPCSGFTRTPGTECFRSNKIFTPRPDLGLTPSFNPNILRVYKFVSECCYNSMGGLITEGEGAGRLTDSSSSSYDPIMRDNCCTEDTTPEDCQNYYNRRPIILMGSADYIAYAVGKTDPHFWSFDNPSRSYQHDFTFVPTGTYTILQVDDSQTELPVFHVQGDFDRNPGYRPSWIKKMAFGVPGVPGAYAFQFVDNNDMPRLLRSMGPGAGQEVTSVDDQFVRITKNGNNVVAFIKSSSILLDMTWYSQNFGTYINFNLCMPRSNCERHVVDGHLGNCDGDLMNDHGSETDPEHLIQSNHPNYMFISAPSGRRKRQTSSYVPYTGPTPDDFNYTDTQRTICNNIRSCMFDLAVTESVELANNSREVNENTEVVKQMIENFPPNITSDNVAFYVTVGEENIYSFEVFDSDDFNVTIEDGIPVDALLHDDGQGNYTFFWTPTRIPTRNLTFMAEDSLGAVALHSPLLQVCACFNGGECVEEGVQSDGQLVQIITCQCTEAYSGATCSEDRNGCSEIECFNGVQCLDVPAPGVGAECGPCPVGFTGNGLKCTDLNECATNSSLCQQVCTNTFGSYECGCYPGFRLLENSSMCEDINECESADRTCQQNCTNEVGSFICSCGEGFSLDENNRTCTPMVTCATSNMCSDICAVVDGEVQCFCPVGFELAMNSATQCEDIDECDRFSPCDQICINTEGSFNCSCNEGYEFSADTQTSTCQDIDECQRAALASSVICTESNTKCVNMPGSFQCVCVDGYNITDGVCQRIVEVEEIVLVVSPLIGTENAVNFIVETYTINQLTRSPETIQAFREATAMAIIRYCRAITCAVVSASGQENRTSLVVAPQEVAVPLSNITAASTDSRPTISFYVQLPNNTFVSSAVLRDAIEQATDLYQQAGHIPYPCDLSPCMNGASCNDSVDEYTCTCLVGFMGTNCEVNIDDCSSNPCNNGATCLDEVNAFTCNCLDGYSGIDCSVDINECTGNPCGMEGTCLDRVNGFVCVCQSGYTSPCEVGATCMDPADETVACVADNEVPLFVWIAVGVVLFVVFVSILLLVVVLCLGYHLVKKSKASKAKNTVKAEPKGDDVAYSNPIYDEMKD